MPSHSTDGHRRRRPTCGWAGAWTPGMEGGAVDGKLRWRCTLVAGGGPLGEATTSVDMDRTKMRQETKTPPPPFHHPRASAEQARPARPRTANPPESANDTRRGPLSHDVRTERRPRPQPRRPRQRPWRSQQPHPTSPPSPSARPPPRPPPTASSFPPTSNFPFNPPPAHHPPCQTRRDHTATASYTHTVPRRVRAVGRPSTRPLPPKPPPPPPSPQPQPPAAAMAATARRRRRQTPPPPGMHGGARGWPADGAPPCKARCRGGRRQARHAAHPARRAPPSRRDGPGKASSASQRSFPHSPTPPQSPTHRSAIHRLPSPATLPLSPSPQRPPTLLTPHPTP